MEFRAQRLANGLRMLSVEVPDTPRLALAVAIDGGVRREPTPAMAKLASRLWLKGTARRDAEALARELDARAIDLREIVLADCMVLMAVFLPRELPAALDILQDILQHSTFADFDKERTKMTGEIQSALDLPAEVAQDLLVSTLFERHPYGNSSTRMLQALPTLSMAPVRDFYYAGLTPARMVVGVAGAFEESEVFPRVEEAFSALPQQEVQPVMPPLQITEGDRVVTRAHADAQQAQVYRAWLAPAHGAPEQPAFTVMNTILGAGGLSSRLFVELRDKQGLAYAVRSQYVPMRQAGEFVVSIGTSPENIARARDGFAEQIARMQHEPITLDELMFAKGKMRGTFVLAHETASQQCLDLVINAVNDRPPDFSEQLLERIMGVTVADVQAAAQQITAPSVTAVVAREEALPAV
jgi:predicted Zn-dependent peptidase